MASPHSSNTMSTKAFSICFFNLTLLLFLLVGSSGITGASLREHRLRGSELESPNEDMLKALEYIESLRQKTGAELQDRHNVGFDDSENLQSVLNMASSSAQNRDLQPEKAQEEEEEDKSQELLQAVLSTLQQTEKASAKKPALPLPIRTTDSETAKPQGITAHKKMPLMFEDEDEEEGEGDQEDFDGGNPFKRTNENVEEKYTPQNLATLQSVFEELGKLTSPNPKRLNDQEHGEVEDLFNVRDVAYDDQDEEEEQEEDDRHEVERALDYLEENEENQDHNSFPVKRSQDPDDLANMADYYLLKVLEQTEEEEQKRALEEEEEQERTERRVSAYRNSNSIDPRLIYQLLQISQKYQIPPEDLIDMLRSGEMSSRKNTMKVAPVYSRKIYKTPQLYNRRLPERQNTPEELRTERILKILGLANDQNSVQTPVRKQSKYKVSPSRFSTTRPTWRMGESALTPQQRLPTKLKGDYDDTENELVTYLAAQMLSKYPTYKKSQKRDEAEDESQSVTGPFEQAIQDYFDQLDLNRSENKRQFEEEERGADEQGFDDEVVMKLLSFVNPDNEEEVEQDAKTKPGI